MWYSLRFDKDRFSTLNQGTGAYCFDTWVKYILSKRPQLTGQFHDEVILEIKPCLLYTSPSPRDQRGSRMPSSA